jgi:hypothetical protein
MTRLKFAILAVGLILLGLAVIIPSWVEEAQRKRDIDAAIEALKEFGGSVNQTNTMMTRIWFRGAALDDQSLAKAVVHLKPFKDIYELDLRRTGITGKTLAALSGLYVGRIVLDPNQINRVSIQQLNECHRIYGIKLTGEDITEEVVMSLIPAFREWILPGGRGGTLELDDISVKGLNRLESEVPNLCGVQTKSGGHPIADAWKGPR